MTWKLQVRLPQTNGERFMAPVQTSNAPVLQENPNASLPRMDCTAVDLERRAARLASPDQVRLAAMFREKPGLMAEYGITGEAAKNPYRAARALLDKLHDQPATEENLAKLRNVSSPSKPQAVQTVTPAPAAPRRETPAPEAKPQPAPKAADPATTAPRFEFQFRDVPGEELKRLMETQKGKPIAAIPGIAEALESLIPASGEKAERLFASAMTNGGRATSVRFYGRDPMISWQLGKAADGTTLRAPATVDFTAHGKNCRIPIENANLKLYEINPGMGDFELGVGTLVTDAGGKATLFCYRGNDGVFRARELQPGAIKPLEGTPPFKMVGRWPGEVRDPIVARANNEAGRAIIAKVDQAQGPVSFTTPEGPLTVSPEGGRYIARLTRADGKVETARMGVNGNGNVDIRKIHGGNVVQSIWDAGQAG